MSKQEEQWTDVPGFEGRYQASNLGRIRSIFKRAAKFGVSRYTIADIRQGKRWATLERAA